MLLGARAVNSADQKIDMSCVQFTGQHLQVPNNNTKGNPRISSRQSVNDWREDRGYHMVAPSNTYLSRGWISEERDVLNALPQFVENRDTALDKSATVRRRLDALPAP